MKLFYQAYPKENQRNREAEGVGGSVLAHQFLLVGGP